MPSSVERTPQEQYGIDFLVKMRELLPFFWEFTIETQTKKVAFIDFAETLFGALKYSNDQFLVLVGFLRDRMSYTGQVLALVELLNDKYDNLSRRISIECLGSNFVEGIDIYTNAETDPTPVILFNNTENNFGLTITLFTNGETMDADSLFGKSFIVHVPTDVTASNELIRSLLNLYVIAPQQYLIERF